MANNKKNNKSLSSFYLYFSLSIGTLVIIILEFSLKIDEKVMIISIATLIVNIIMLVVAIQGIIIPLQKRNEDEQEKNDKAISILNTIIRDKKTRLNFIYIALNIYKVTNCKENMYKTFKNENVELMSFTISHLRNSKFVDKVQDLRNEYTGFLYSRFDMLKQSDIDNTKEKITVIDKVLKDTYSIYNLVPEELLKEKVSVFEIENYLKNDINEY